MVKTCRLRLPHIISNYRGKATLGLAVLLSIFSLALLAHSYIYTREAQAAANTNINFQARLLTSGGALVPDGNYSIAFKVYPAVSGGSAPWTETQVVSVKNGYASVSLGSVTPFSGSGIDWTQEQWLTMNVNGDGEMSPRMKITAVPLALRSVQSDSLTNGVGTISASSLAQLAPGSVQSINSANTALRIAQLGSGGLLQLQNSGGDKFTVANSGDTNIGGSLTVSSGVTVGNSTSTTAGTIRWTGSVFEGYNGTNWASLGGSSLGNPIINKVKLADEIQNSALNATAVLQNDDELFFGIGAFETWTYRFIIQGNANATPDFKFAVSGPAGAVCKVSYSDPEGATSISNVGCGVSTGLIAGNTANDLYEIVGTVTNGATAGTVQLLWAQNTANAANSTIFAGSSVLATRAVGPNGSSQAFIQNGNSFGADAFLGTNDNNNLNFITNGTTKITVLANGFVGIGDSTPSSLLTVGNADAFRVDANGNILTSGTLTVSGVTTLNESLIAGGSVTGTVSNTEPTPRTNVTSIITTTAVFSNDDVIFINNAGQDYYTRVVSGGGTTNLVVSPAVSYDASATVTKYLVQNIGATATNYNSQSNRFFQGYFLGGVVVGAGSTIISDGNIESTTTLHLQRSGGALEVGGDLNILGSLSGNGSGLTNIDGSQIILGSIQDTSLSSNVTLSGNTFNGNNQLVQLNGSGALPALSGANVISLNASNIASGTLNDSRLSSNVVLLNANQIFSGTNQFNNTLTVNGNSFLNANITLGDAAGDIITLNSNTMNLNNSLNIGSSSLYIDSNNKWLGINTSSSQNRLTINTPNTADSAAQLFIYTNANANKGLVIQSTSGQTGNLQEWQLSNGTAPTVVNASGQIISTTNLASTGLANNLSSSNSFVQTTSSGTIISSALASNVVTLSVQNTNASATGDLIQLKNSGGVSVTQFNSSGQLVLGNDAATPVSGVLQLNDATAANNFRISLSSVSNLTNNRNISLPDESGTVCLSNSNSCGYIRLASGSAQADATTNASIFINKTGATGDIITLQDNSTSVFRVANDGSLEIRQTSTTAMVIKNLGGTDFFSVDTNGAIIRVGSATADGTGALLVLDTKNTAGDPTGVNGGMYYNSVDGKNRCYENGAWIDCSTTRLAGESTLGAAAGTINLSLNGNYEYLECRVDIKSRSVANMVYLRFNNDSGGASYGWNSYGIVAAATVDWQDASDSEIQLPGTQTGSNPFSADIKITNFADTNKVIDWTAAGVEPVNTNSNRYSGVGGYYNTTAQISSVQFVTSAGTFSAGSHAWCQGKNIR
jgi:hypothetical protein